MQRSIRILKFALPLAILAFLGYIVVQWSARPETVSRKAGTEPVVGTRPGDTPRLESKVFEDTQTIGGRVVSRIVATRLVSYSSGWNTLEGVTLTLYRENGLTYVIACPSAEFNSLTKEAEAKGGVRVNSSDGIEIRTAEIRYDGARLTNEIPVEFRVDRWNGKAGALDLDVQGETLRLHKSVVATMAAASPAEEPMTIRGAESLFKRRENTVEFQQKVQMDRGVDALRAEYMIGRFTPDRKQLDRRGRHRQLRDRHGRKCPAGRRLRRTQRDHLRCVQHEARPRRPDRAHRRRQRRPHGPRGPRRSAASATSWPAASASRSPIAPSARSRPTGR